MTYVLVLRGFMLYGNVKSETSSEACGRSRAHIIGGIRETDMREQEGQGRALSLKL